MLISERWWRVEVVDGGVCGDGGYGKKGRARGSCVGCWVLDLGPWLREGGWSRTAPGNSVLWSFFVCLSIPTDRFSSC